ncbi:MAG: DUF5610 domain-containing protein [Pseudomonadota bacterium]
MSNPVGATGSGNAAAVANDAPASNVPVGAKAKAELNVSIVRASLTVSLKAGDEPLALLYKSAITSINEALKGQYGEDAIENAVGQDNTPEGTAGRIVQLSTAFYDAYKEQHGGDGADEASQRQAFIDTIRGGVEKGFKEARDILDGLKVLNGDVAGNIDKTYELVQKGLDDFLKG